MAMCNYWYIFNSKVDEFLGVIKGSKTYIDDIMVISKDFIISIEHIGLIYIRLYNNGLKVNSNSCSLGLKYITYLCYKITW